MRFWVGVSGFSYASWKGVFYPETTKSNQMLEAYASKLNSVEVNSSFYHMPTPKTTSNWATSTPDAFRFSFKTNRKITHFMKLKGANKEFQIFLNGLDPLGPKLGSILVQLPPYMKQDYGTLETFLSEKPKAVEVAIEFRHDSWFGHKLNGLLSKYSAALCVADTEDMKPIFTRTSDFCYVRLRRNEYSKKQLEDWSKRLLKFANGLDRCYVYFRHDKTGKAANGAAEFSIMLNG